MKRLGSSLVLTRRLKHEGVNRLGSSLILTRRLNHEGVKRLGSSLILTRRLNHEGVKRLGSSRILTRHLNHEGNDLAFLSFSPGFSGVLVCKVREKPFQRFPWANGQLLLCFVSRSVRASQISGKNFLSSVVFR